MWRSRTFWRLFSAYGALLVLSVGVLGAVVIHRVENDLLRQIEETLTAKAVLVREVARPLSGSALQERVQGLRADVPTRITLLDDEGRVLADSEADSAHMENHADRPEVAAARQFGTGAARRPSGTLRRDLLYVALRCDPPAGAVAYVRVALPLDAVQERVAGLHRLVWSAVVATGLAGLVLAFWVARRSARPLQELTEGVERIKAGGFGHKVYAAGHDEVAVLAQTINQMSERLAEQFAQLEEDRQQLRAVLSGMVEGVIALDAEQRVLFGNDRAAQLLGFDPRAAVGRKLWEVVRHRPIQDVVSRALAGPQPCSQELNWSGPEARSLAVHAARLPGAPTRGAVVVLHDTTELRRLERLRQEFVANVSHELKTPLSVIKACVETLLDGAADDPADRTTFLQQVADQAERLHRLILDLLSLARIESGAEAFEFQAVPLGDLVADCLERHRARAEARQQTLEAAPGPDGAAAWADEEAVNQILDNLVDNAVKYTPEGGRITVRWLADDGQVTLEVRDTGIGIPEPDLPRIFERFYRVDKARSRELGGTGLGLSIVKHLVGALHGTVGAASQLGRGTTFTVRLPRAPAS